MTILSGIAHPAVVYLGIFGFILAYLLGRKKQSLNLLKQFIQTPMGIMGSATVAFFAGLAIFGDILAPYDPEEHLTGMPFRPPSPLPYSQALVLNLSLMLIALAVLVGLYCYRAGIKSLPEGFSGGILGGTLSMLGLLLGSFSFSENYAIGVVASAVIAITGGYFMYANRQKVRGHEKKEIQQTMPALMALVFLAAGFLIFIISSITVITQNPTAFPGYHILGTDQLGRDTFSQLVIGVRITLVIGFVATLITMTIGTLIGLLVGYYGGMLDSFLMRFTDIFFVIPSLVIMIILAAILPPSVYTLIFIIGIFSWPSTARIVRGQVLTIKERGYIDRVKAVGGSNVYIMGKHVLPAVAPLIVANTVLVTAYAILSEVVLDFFGLGDPSMVSWGTMLYQAFGSGAMSSNIWWLVFPPGIAVVLLLMGVSMVGYAMDEIANPKLRRR
jgi:peptide/nickel transport system permease protein